MSIAVQSPAFGAGHAIPKTHTGDGEDLSPELTWSGVPWGTVEFALIMDDPDAPTSEPWVHWVLCKIPGHWMGLPGGFRGASVPAGVTGLLQGTNSWGTPGYRGPAPPRGHGRHHYHFRLYALNAPLTVAAGLDKAALQRAMHGKILAEGDLVGTYQR